MGTCGFLVVSLRSTQEIIRKDNRFVESKIMICYSLGELDVDLILPSIILCSGDFSD